MSSLTFDSVNFRGLFSDKVKRTDIFNKCRNLYDISILVDTHCTKEVEQKWLTEWGYKGFFSSHTSNSRGVAILFKNSFEYKIHDMIKDKDGHFLILDITLQEYRISLVAVYGPNIDNPMFFENLKNKITLLNNSSVIISGDWNVVQDYISDTRNYRGLNNPNSNKKLKEIIQDLDLVDIWREQHPGEHLFTWRGPHKKLSRLDYFLISSDIAALVADSDIGISYRSDHSPVILKLKFCNQSRGAGTWKFNNSLLYDTEYVNKVKNCIKDVLNEYRVSNIETS